MVNPLMIKLCRAQFINFNKIIKHQILWLLIMKKCPQVHNYIFQHEDTSITFLHSRHISCQLLQLQKEDRKRDGQRCKMMNKEKEESRKNRISEKLTSGSEKKVLISQSPYNQMLFMQWLFLYLTLGFSLRETKSHQI